MFNQNKSGGGPSSPRLKAGASGPKDRVRGATTARATSMTSGSAVRSYASRSRSSVHQTAAGFGSGCSARSLRR